VTVRPKLSGSKLLLTCLTLTVLKLGIPSCWLVNKDVTNRHGNKQQTKVASFNHFTLKDSRTHHLSCGDRGSSSPTILPDCQLDRTQRAVIDREHTDPQRRPTAVCSSLWTNISTFIIHLTFRQQWPNSRSLRGITATPGQRTTSLLLI